MKKVVLQKLVFPYGERLGSEWNLFWHGPRGIVKDGKVLYTPAYDCLDFASYINGVPMSKWRRYTGISSLTLTLEAKGHFSVKLTGYSLNPEFPERHEYSETEFDLAEKTSITLSYPEQAAEDFLAFDFLPFSECEIYGGYYETEVEENSIRSINLVISTTTCKKEQYIKGNVKLIRESLLESDDPIREHLYLNVVDNGQTLSEEDIYGYHVKLYPNNNAGGSGGYSRGMIEALHMDPEPTHVLLMDDDVLVLPDSIRRTYTLLQLLKPEYHEAFIAGAMLKLDAMWEMHEDIGSITDIGEFFHVKPGCSIFELKNILDVNREYPKVDRMYAAWWYCCMPIENIRKHGLSYPFFIRLDDAEYSLRSNVDILTMSGICIWHLGFENKFKEAMDYYQRFRNSFVLKDISDQMDNVDMIGRFKREILRNELLFNYDGIEALLLGFEDYMKGPKFFMEDRGFELMKRNSAYNQKLTPLAQRDDAGVVLYTLNDQDVPMSLKDRAIYYLTINGQRWYTPRSKKGTAFTFYDWAHDPGKVAGHDTIMAINPADRTGVLRKKDKKRFEELHRRYKKDLKYYERNHEKIRNAFRETFPYMVSEKFWIKYLKLDEAQYK